MLTQIASSLISGLVVTAVLTACTAVSEHAPVIQQVEAQP